MIKYCLFLQLFHDFFLTQHSVDVEEMIIVFFGHNIETLHGLGWFLNSPILPGSLCCSSPPLWLLRSSCCSCCCGCCCGGCCLAVSVGGLPSALVEQGLGGDAYPTEQGVPPPVLCRRGSGCHPERRGCCCCGCGCCDWASCRPTTTSFMNNLANKQKQVLWG